MPRLEQVRNRVSTVERLWLDALRSNIQGDLPGRLRIAQELVQLTPGSVEAVLAVVQAAARMNRPWLALDALAQSDPERGLNLVSPSYWVWQSTLAHDIGEHGRALEAAREGVRRFPDRWPPHLALVRALATLGRSQDLEAQLRTPPPVPSPSRYARTSTFVRRYSELEAVRELRAHGHNALVTRMLARIATDLPPRPADTASAAEQHVHGELLYETRRWEEAAAVFRSLAAEDSSDSRAAGYLGAIAARRGDAEQARAISAKLASLHSLYLHGRHLFGRARIAAILALRDEAVRLLRTAFAEGHPVD